MSELSTLVEALEAEFSTIPMPSQAAPIETNTCTIGCTRNLCDDTDGCTRYCTWTCTHGC